MTKTHCIKLSKNIKKGRNEKAKKKRKGKGKERGKSMARRTINKIIILQHILLKQALL